MKGHANRTIFGDIITGYTALVLGVFLLIGLAAGAWFVWIQIDTAFQPAQRNNANNQAGTVIANNAYLHTLLGQIGTDKTDVRRFSHTLDTFCLIHALGGRSGDACARPGGLAALDYNTQQEYQRDQDNYDGAYTALANDANQYNAYFSNSDITGVDASLPRHINPDGSYTNGNGAVSEGVK